jgi:hypothetical protein
MSASPKGTSSWISRRFRTIISTWSNAEYGWCQGASPRQGSTQYLKSMSPLANLSYRRPFTRTNYNSRSRSEAEIYKYFASSPASILEKIQAVRRTPPHLSLLAQAKAKYSQRSYGAINGWGYGKQSNERTRVRQ